MMAAEVAPIASTKKDLELSGGGSKRWGSDMAHFSVSCESHPESALILGEIQRVGGDYGDNRKLESTGLERTEVGDVVAVEDVLGTLVQSDDLAEELLTPNGSEGEALVRVVEVWVSFHRKAQLAEEGDGLKTEAAGHITGVVWLGGGP